MSLFTESILLCYGYVPIVRVCILDSLRCILQVARTRRRTIIVVTFCLSFNGMGKHIFLVNGNKLGRGLGQVKVKGLVTLLA